MLALALPVYQQAATAKRLYGNLIGEERTIADELARTRRELGGVGHQARTVSPGR
jgi:hypothetical protein